MKRQKVPDDENIDINKIAQVTGQKMAEIRANITAKQHKDKEAKRLVPEKAKRIQGQNDMKEYRSKKTYDRKSQNRSTH